MRCPNCGSEVDPSTSFCPVCGTLCDGNSEEYDKSDGKQSDKEKRKPKHFLYKKPKNKQTQSEEPENKQTRHESSGNAHYGYSVTDSTGYEEPDSNAINYEDSGSDPINYEDPGSDPMNYEDPVADPLNYDDSLPVKKKEKKKSYKIPIIAGVVLAAVIGLTWTLSAKITTKKIGSLSNNSDTASGLTGDASDTQTPSEDLQDETAGLEEIEARDYKVALICAGYGERSIKIVDGFNEICDGRECEYFLASDHQEQVELVAECQESGVEAVIVEMIDPDHAGEIILAARGMPVVFVNEYPESSDQLKEGAVTYVGPDYYEIGVMQGAFLTDVFEESGQDTIASVSMYLDAVPPRSIMQYSGYCDALEYAGMKESGYSMLALSADSRRASHETLKYDTIARLLKFLDLLDCVVAENDRMALGVIDCLEDYGMDTTDIPVVSGELTKEGLQAIKDGKLDMSVYIDYEWMGETAAVAAINLIEGDPLNKYLESEQFELENETTIWLPCWPVLAENADDFDEYIH